MRIIDKNTDFYDYYQNIYPDDSITFDRRDSFVVTKEIMCCNLNPRTRWYPGKNDDNYGLVLLQICNTFWLFLLEVIKYNEYDMAVDYQIELLTTWKNYNKPRVLISLDVIQRGYGYGLYSFCARYGWKSIVDRIDIIDRLVQMIDTNNYKVERSINRHTVYCGDHREERHIPLLKACGIAKCVDPLDVFLSFEEYFSLEKTASERRDPIGTTDIDKVESHGFDTKLSFRGKQK